MYTRDEVKSAACDMHACSRTPVSMSIHWLHDQVTAITKPFAQMWATFDFVPRPQA